MEDPILEDVQQVDGTSPAKDIVYPAPTQWEITTRCCCCSPCVRVESDPERQFWGHWERFLCMPIFVSCLVFFTLLVWIFLVYNKYEKRWMRIAAPVEVGFTLVMFLWSYFGASCMDPGYLPFDWVREKRLKYTWQEQLTGLGVRQDQIEFAKSHRPKFASFSKSAGRFVIRADHICGWIANWVGKRNHKQFMLMNLWGSLYSASLFVWNILGAKALHPENLFEMAAVLVAFGTEAVFGFALMFVFGYALKDLANNVTKIQKWKNEQTENGGNYTCMQSMREVCGNGSVFCWCVPTPAFGDDMRIDEDLPEIEDVTY